MLIKLTYYIGVKIRGFWRQLGEWYNRDDRRYGLPKIYCERYFDGWW